MVSVSVSVPMPVNCPPLDTWHPSELFIYLFAHSGLQKKISAHFSFASLLNYANYVLTASSFSSHRRTCACLSACGRLPKGTKKGKSLERSPLPRNHSNLRGPKNRKALNFLVWIEVFINITILWHCCIGNL